MTFYIEALAIKSCSDPLIQNKGIWSKRARDLIAHRKNANYQWSGFLFLFFILIVAGGSSTMKESLIPQNKVKMDPSVDLSGT